MDDELRTALAELSVQRFLADEARLLDEGRFDQWLELFAAECTYELHCLELVSEQRRGGRPPSPVRHLMASDDRARLALRVARLERGLAGAERPPSVTRRLVTNIRLAAHDGATALVHSHVLVHQVRFAQHTLVGSREDHLERSGDGWAIRRRTVVLDHTDLPRTLTQLL